jgi:hypothetical protein
MKRNSGCRTRTRSWRMRHNSQQERTPRYAAAPLSCLSRYADAAVLAAENAFEELDCARGGEVVRARVQ